MYACCACVRMLCLCAHVCPCSEVAYIVMHVYKLVFTLHRLWVASGLFVPTMLVGGAMGRAVGEIVNLIFPNVDPHIDPSIYSMVGSAGLMAGTTRMTISLVCTAPPPRHTTRTTISSRHPQHAIIKLT